MAIELNTENLIEIIKDFYPDLRPSVPEGKGRFVEREIVGLGHPVKKSHPYDWPTQYKDMQATSGILACGEGFFTFVPLHGDTKWTKDEVFWLALYRTDKYDGFIPVGPEDILHTARRLNQDFPEADGEGLLIQYLESLEPGGESMTKEEIAAVEDFLHQALMASLSDAIFTSITG